MELDERYGELLNAVSPGGGNAVEDWERTYFPRSMSTLTSTSAAHLSGLMSSVSKSCRLDQFLVLDIVILWLVNENGDVVFAVEEAVSDGLPLDVPRHRRAEHKIGKDKLGHPSLVAGGKARIAGEIYYDIRRNAWMINMKSGRYSAEYDRTKGQLTNVSNQFRDHGIILTVEY